MPNLACASATAARLAEQQLQCSAAAAVPEAKAVPKVDTRDAVYLLNPSGDLPATQATFEGLFRAQAGWQVPCS